MNERSEIKSSYEAEKQPSLAEYIKNAYEEVSFWNEPDESEFTYKDSGHDHSRDNRPFCQLKYTQGRLDASMSIAGVDIKKERYLGSQWIVTENNQDTGLSAADALDFLDNLLSESIQDSHLLQNTPEPTDKDAFLYIQDRLLDTPTETREYSNKKTYKVSALVEIDDNMKPCDLELGKEDLQDGTIYTFMFTIPYEINNVNSRVEVYFDSDGESIEPSAYVLDENKQRKKTPIKNIRDLEAIATSNLKCFVDSKTLG